MKIPTLNNKNEILWLPIWLPIHSRGFAELLSMRVVGICCSAFESPMSHDLKIAVKPVKLRIAAIFYVIIIFGYTELFIVILTKKMKEPSYLPLGFIRLVIRD